MKACWCSLAGTSACRSCSNNPYADFPPTVRTNTVTVTDRTFYTQGDRISDFEKLINASDLIEWIMETYPDWCVGAVRSIVDHVEQMPSAQPYSLDEWCDTCKEYDSERHCCPRYNRVIRDALKMRKRGKWIIEKDATGATYGRCSVCGIKQYGGHMNFCYECGADMRGEGDEVD